MEKFIIGLTGKKKAIIKSSPMQFNECNPQNSNFSSLYYTRIDTKAIVRNIILSQAGYLIYFI